MGMVLFILALWPLALAIQIGLYSLGWLIPGGPGLLPRRCQQVIETATVVEVHYAEHYREEPPASNGDAGPLLTRDAPDEFGFRLWGPVRSLGMVRLDSKSDRRTVARALVQAIRPMYFRALCVGVEYVVRFESEQGRVDLMICFDCMKVWVVTAETPSGSEYPIWGSPRSLLDRLLRKAGVPEPSNRPHH